MHPYSTSRSLLTTCFQESWEMKSAQRRKEHVARDKLLHPVLHVSYWCGRRGSWMRPRAPSRRPRPRSTAPECGLPWATVAPPPPALTAEVSAARQQAHLPPLHLAPLHLPRSVLCQCLPGAAVRPGEHLCDLLLVHADETASCCCINFGLIRCRIVRWCAALLLRGNGHRKW